jgi:hypothetical protein
VPGVFGSLISGGFEDPDSESAKTASGDLAVHICSSSADRGRRAVLRSVDEAGSTSTGT